MKKTLLLLSILMIGISASAQKSDPMISKGKWFVQQEGNNNIILNFIDSTRSFFSLGSADKWKGNYNYTTRKSGTVIIINLQPVDNTYKASFQINLTKISDEEYKINDILRLYEDGRPPESELLENKVYILKKVK